MGSWSQWLGFLPYLIGIVVAGGAIGGLVALVPVMIQGWAWRRLADDTPVAQEDEGLGF